MKDLGRLGRDLASTLIVDDCEQAALFQPNNWVPIRPFEQSESGWKEDTSLLDILLFLRDQVCAGNSQYQPPIHHLAYIMCVNSHGQPHLDAQTVFL